MQHSKVILITHSVSVRYETPAQLKTLINLTSRIPSLYVSLFEHTQLVEFVGLMTSLEKLELILADLKLN
jgi:hypothetical protein